MADLHIPISPEVVQALLDEHGPWSVDAPVRFVEHADVMLVVEAFGDASAADVVVTVRSRRGIRDLGSGPSETSVELVDRAGTRYVGEQTRRGQLRYRDVQTGTWNFVAAASSRAAPVTDELAARRLASTPAPRFHRIDRVLPAAAASGRAVISVQLHSDDAELITDAHESDEGRLVVTLTTAARVAPGERVEHDLAIAQLRWSVVGAPGVEPTVHILRTPLSARHRDEPASARYDLGDVSDAEAVDIEPAELITIERVTVADVAAAFRLGQLGSARRAWTDLASRDWCPSDVRAAIEAAIDPRRS